MLRKLRLTLAVIFFALITLLFLDFSVTIHHWLGWMAKIQFMPALLALNVGVILFLVLMTLLFGRIYCSVICPLGVFQDIAAWLGKQRKKLPYTYSPAINWLRYGFLAVFVFGYIAGVSVLVSILEPYSAFGRMVSSLAQPVWLWGNNLLAHLAERADSYAFYSVDVWMKSLATFIIAVVTFVVLVVLAWRNGRTYCNTVCPVGTILGFLSRFSLFRVAIDADKCNNCTLCARNCKASCIDVKNFSVDYSRCVDCMDCLGKCKRDAIHYKPVWGKVRKPAETPIENTHQSSSDTNANRRSFLSVAALVATSSLVKAQEKKVDGGLATIEDKKIPKRLTPITPAGSLGVRNFTNACTACQLCISACPNGVLRPSTSLETFMQPEVSYERGYCRPECTLCSSVCPAGAIRPISEADKSATQIGHAVWIEQNCVALTDGVNCGNCERHCPVGAIQMVAYDPEIPGEQLIPVVNTERCIGCGACENLCPSRPFSAIYVEGHERHRLI